MSSKRFRGKVCVYCSDRMSVTGDHVFAREFFVPTARADLPLVPACERCNNEKSKLEHYLTAILPFGARHTDAHETLASFVPGRLAKNARLRRELQVGQGRTWHYESKLIHYAMTVPIDASRVNALFALVARALTWLHFGVRLSPAHTSNAIFLSRLGEEYFARLFARNAAKRARADLARGAVSYEGAQAVDAAQLTIWRFQFYGGMALSGDPASPDQVATVIGAMTGPAHLTSMLDSRGA